MDDDDALQRAYHVGCHADTGHTIVLQRIEKILNDGQIRFRCYFRLPAQENDVMNDIANHSFSFHKK